MQFKKAMSPSSLFLGIFVMLGIFITYADAFANDSSIHHDDSQYTQDISTPYTTKKQPLSLEEMKRRESLSPKKQETFLPENAEDGSLTIFLDDTHPFQNVDYKPIGLIAINSHFTFNDASKYLLREEAATAFADMAWAFWDAFDQKQKISIVSSYRSKGLQQRLKESRSSVNCALPGHSEHQAGLALDLGVGGRSLNTQNSLYYERLADNAHLYGFHNTYQKGVEVDGKMVEPWHWRYIGVELATLLHDRGQTLAEYYYELYPHQKTN